MNDRRLMVLWLNFLNILNENTRELPPEMLENEFIRKAAELCERGAFTPEELEAYDKYWDIIRTEKSIREGARQEGLEEGRAEGRVEGRAEGRAEGEIHALEQVVVDAKQNGFSLEQIQSFTKLPVEKIIEILKRNTL